MIMKKIILLFLFLFSLNIFAQEMLPPGLEGEMPGMPMENQMPAPDGMMPPTPQSRPNQLAVPEKDDPTVTEGKAEESKVYLDFRDADIREVARILSKISGTSILVSEDVKAKVTLNIEGVEWREALDLILRTYNLAKIEKEDFVIIVTYKKIQEEQDQVPLETKIITLNFVDIDEAKTYLKTIMSKRGTIEGDPRTNSLIVTDTPEIVEKVAEIAKNLDIKTPQVLIEVLMVDKKDENDKDLGINWKLENRGALDADGNPLEFIEQDFGTFTNAVGTLQYGKSVFGRKFLDATLKVWKQKKLVDIIANPKILTLDNITAKIDIIEQVAYTSESSSTEGGTTTSTQFKDIGISVNVKPHITKDGYIIMDIETEQSFLVGRVDGQPQLDKRTSETTMMVYDGETIVIGGLQQKNKTTTEDKIPLLGDIPLIGKLFTRQQLSDDSRELLIFVTPTIIADTLKSTKSKEMIPNHKDIAVYEKAVEIHARKRLPVLNNEDQINEISQQIEAEIKSMEEVIEKDIGGESLEETKEELEKGTQEIIQDQKTKQDPAPKEIEEKKDQVQETKEPEAEVEKAKEPEKVEIKIIEKEPKETKEPEKEPKETIKEKPAAIEVEKTEPEPEEVLPDFNSLGTLPLKEPNGLP